MKQKTYIFDLDGTVVNPGTAIPRCINHALKKFNIKAVPIERLKRYIGFPLDQIFQQITGRKDKRFIKGCVDAYRERFHKEGVPEHRLYPGIVGLLEAVSEEGNVIIATNKPEASCKMVLDHLGISKFFTKIYGLEATNGKEDKTQLFKEVAKQEKLKSALVIGDRGTDVEGAKKCKFTAIGVSYGYGTRDELSSAGADHVAETVGELRQCLLVP